MAINDVLIVTAAVGFATLILFSEIDKQKKRHVLSNICGLKLELCDNGR
jgi:hypothetical protein